MSVCLGREPDRRLLVSLELCVICLALILCFLTGRLTAEWDFVSIFFGRFRPVSISGRGAFEIEACC